MDSIKWTSASSCRTPADAQFEKTEKSGISCTWKSLLDTDISSPTAAKSVVFAWQFEWDELMKQGIEGFEGTITVSYRSASQNVNVRPAVGGFPIIFPVELTRSGQWIEKCLGSMDVVGTLFNKINMYFKCSFDMKPISIHDESRFLEETFAASDKTDAILVVEDKKLHVNKQFLSFHSDYFNTLFNSEFKEKLMDEIPIEDVKYDDFARLLSAVYPHPILPTVSTFVNLLELADRFMMPMVTRLVEPFLIRNESVEVRKKISLADKYFLNELLQSCLDSIKSVEDGKKITERTSFEELSDATKVKVFSKILSFV